VFERARWRKFTELVPDHVFRDVNGEELFPVVNVEIEPNEVRRNRRTTRPSFDGFAISAFLRGEHFVHQRRFNVKAFFN